MNVPTSERLKASFASMDRRVIRFLIGTSIFTNVVFVLIFLKAIEIDKFASVSNFMLVLLTAGYVSLTYFMLKSTERSNQEHTRPFVIASLPTEGFNIVLLIQNIGSRPAYDVSITFNPNLESLADKSVFKGMSTPLLKHGFLAPSAKLSNPVGSTPDFLALQKDNSNYEVTVDYKDSVGRAFHDSYVIDLGSYIYSKKVIDKSIEDHLHSIAESLKLIVSQKSR